MKTFREKALLLEEEGVPPEGTPLPVTGVAPKVAPEVPQAQSFGDKAKKFNRQVNLPGTPFNLSSWTFQNRKLYYLNIFGAWRNKDEEEQINLFVQACEAMIAKAEAANPVPDNPAFETATAKRIGEELLEFASETERASGPVGGRESISGSRVYNRQTSLQKLFHQYKIMLKPEKAESLRKNPKELFKTLSNAFPEYEIEYDTNISQAPEGAKTEDGKDYGGARMVYDDEVKRNTVTRNIRPDTDPVSVRNRVVRFARSIDGQVVSERGGQTEEDNAMVFYKSIPTVVNELNKMYHDEKSGESMYGAKSRQDFDCQPFKSNGAIYDFACWVNVIQNRVVEQTRNNVGVSPYMVLETYLNAAGVMDEPLKLGRDTSKPRNMDPEQMDDMEGIRQEGVIEEESAGRGSNAYQGARRVQVGGEIYHTRRQLPSHREYEREGLGHVTPAQMKTFHQDMVEYFLKSGLLIYLFPEQHDKLVKQGGSVTNAIKQAAKSVYSMGANAPDVQT